MATTNPKAPRKTLALPLAAQIAHEHTMAVLQSTATAEILDEDGARTDRLVYLGQEYSSKFLAAHGLSGEQA